jgi:hypothetical protein
MNLATDLILDCQDQFFTKEIWVKPMTSSATSTSNQSEDISTTDIHAFLLSPYLPP